MKRTLTGILLAVAALLANTSTSQAQQHPHFPPFGCCGGFCVGFLSKLHSHGPLYNYGPYSGYYPFEPYGPWTSDLRYNPPQAACGSCGRSNCGGHGLGHGLVSGWAHYAVNTLKNVCHRVNPLANRCGGGLKLGNCGSGKNACATSSGCAPSTSDACAPAASDGCAVSAPAAAPVESAQPITSATPVPVTMPIPMPLAPGTPAESIGTTIQQKK